MVNHLAMVERAEIIREKGTNRSKFIRGEVQDFKPGRAPTTDIFTRECKSEASAKTARENRAHKQIADDTQPALLRRQRSEVHPQHIGFDDFQLRMAAQMGGQVAVEFDHGQPAEALHQRLGQRGQTGPDLHHRLAGHRGDGGHNGVDDAVVGQEVLAETLAGDMAHNWGSSRIST